jgi:microcystin-dependent protein
MIKQIALAATLLACVFGGARAQAVSPFVGEIETFSFSFCPNGWLPTNGQLVSTTTYNVLFNLIGTKYGGDGVTTFALPNTRVVQTVNKVKLTQCISYLGVFPLQG